MIMTPKEKADELYNYFYQHCVDSNSPRWMTKLFASKCVDEILNSSPSLPCLSNNGTYGSDIEESTKFWIEVKAEIEKL